uniref:Uncharacterized protein n=1 Tax=virus sp. ctML55 TaxID=2827627 RepID=A0A8S5RIK2_9VIRU|nr:MAG TPA: hypothetical protein [virus sp. ctML55]
MHKRLWNYFKHIFILPPLLQLGLIILDRINR